jgi:hypothetical protein
VESSCEFGIEPSGSMKFLSSGLTSSGLSSSAQLHIVSYCYGNIIVTILVTVDGFWNDDWIY